MAIGVRCENSGCRKLIRVKEEFQGKRVKCPACGQLLPPAIQRPEVVEQLDSLAQKIRVSFQKAPDKLLRSKFDAVVAGPLAEAMALARQVKKTPALAEDPTVAAAFDDLSTAIQEGLADNLDLTEEAEDRAIMYGDPLRALMYMAILKRRLLDFILTAAKRQELERSLRRTIEVLYQDFEPPADLDPARCFFFPQRQATAEAALEVPMFRITKSSGPSVEYLPRRMLLPRSPLAAELHTHQANVFTLTAVTMEPVMSQLEEAHEPLADFDDARMRGEAYFRGLGGWWWMELPAMALAGYAAYAVTAEVLRIFDITPLAAVAVGCFLALLPIRFVVRPILRSFVSIGYESNLKLFLNRYAAHENHLRDFVPFANALKNRYQFGFTPGPGGEEELKSGRLINRWFDTMMLTMEIEEQMVSLQSLEPEEKTGLRRYIETNGKKEATAMLRKLKKAPPGPERDALLLSLRVLGQRKEEGEQGSNR